MKMTALLFSLAAACLASSAYANDVGQASMRQAQQDAMERYGRMERDARQNGQDRPQRLERVAQCDFDRPWVHERNHRHHSRVGGAGPCHDIHRGEQLPRYYWDARYDVHDWRRHDLPRPWRDHRWVRTGNDFAMVNVHSGTVSKLILLRHRRR